MEWLTAEEFKKSIDPQGKLTYRKRDSLGRVYEKLYPDGAKEQMAYQPHSGRLASMTRPGDTTPAASCEQHRGRAYHQYAEAPPIPNRKTNPGENRVFISAQRHHGNADHSNTRVVAECELAGVFHLPTELLGVG